MTITLHTVGHSDRTLDELLDLLRQAGTHTVVDVRQQAEAMRDTRFTQEMLREVLGSAGLTYHYAGRQLGGSRQLQSESPHSAMTDPRLCAYADYMATEIFKKAAVQLIHLGTLASTTILAAERDPMNCETSLIADYLTLQGITVMHLFDSAPGQAHLLRPEARRESAQLIYDRLPTSTVS